MSDKSFERIFHGLRVRFRYHPKTRLWSALLISKDGKGSIAAGSRSSIEELEKMVHAMLGRSAGKN